MAKFINLGAMICLKKKFWENSRKIYCIFEENNVFKISNLKLEKSLLPRQRQQACSRAPAEVLEGSLTARNASIIIKSAIAVKVFLLDFSDFFWSKIRLFPVRISNELGERMI